MAAYVIIGNGVAAAGCIEGIRSVDPISPITVVSKENHPVYCRPLISYYLEGKTPLERMSYRPEDFYDRHSCQVLYGKEAVRIDRDASSVQLDDGSTLPYTSLCIASGSSPFVPPFAGLDTVEKKFPFMTLDDTLALEQAITPDSKVLIIGAGLIGLKCAEGLCGRVASITVCDLADRILSSILDNECAALMQQKLEDHGISFMLSDSAVSFDTNKAVMKSGKVVDFDVLVLAVGVRPNTQLAKDAGLECGRGIQADEGMHTSDAAIFTAGDCAEGLDAVLGSRRILAILPNAYMQGHCAGVNMAGGTESFTQGIPMNSIGFFGYHTHTAGMAFPEADGGVTIEEKQGDTIRRFFIKDNLLTGFMLLGKPEKTGIYTALIRNKTPLDTIDFDAMMKSPSFVSFSTETRSKMLGGVV